MKKSLLVVGQIGCGKSTVIRQIMRMYPDTFEQIRPDLGAVPPHRKRELLRNLANGTRYITEYNTDTSSIDPRILAYFVVIDFACTPTDDLEAVLSQDAEAVMQAYRDKCDSNNPAKPIINTNTNTPVKPSNMQTLSPIATIPATMSSREIADLTGKEHKNVLRDCDTLNQHYAEMGGLLKIEQAPYIHPDNGQEYREYHLSRMQTFDLITGYDIKLRIRVNRRWEELEQLRGAVPAAELTNLRAEIAQLRAEQADLRSLVRIGRREGAQPKAGAEMPAEHSAHIVRFWESLAAYPLISGVHYAIDLYYLYVRMHLVMPFYEAYCRERGIAPLSSQDMHRLLCSGLYAPYVASTQKGSHRSYKKAGLGRCLRFRYESVQGGIAVGGCQLTISE